MSLFVGGGKGIRSRLRARSGCVLTRHRRVIHSAPVRILSNTNKKASNPKIAGSVAEGKEFEPLWGCPQTVFKKVRVCHG